MENYLEDEEDVGLEVPESDFESMSSGIEKAKADAQKSRLFGAVADNLANRRSFGEFFTGKFAPTQGPSLATQNADVYGKDAERLRGTLDKYRLAKSQAQAKAKENMAQLLGKKEDRAAQHQNDMALVREKARLEQGRPQKESGPTEYQQFAMDERKRKAEQEAEALEVPGVGTARNKDDAKVLKDAAQSKQSLSRKLQEMVALRKKYGAEFFNREAVGRGKQLSKDALLEYKNLAKLGVLSQSDRDLVEAIIPEDPLAMDGVLGQDSIMSNLEKFSGDVDKDFQAGVALRTRGGAKSEEPAMVTVIAPDGRRKLIAREQLQDALAAGGKLESVAR